MDKQAKVTDVLIGEIDLLRRKIEALVLLLDEKGVISREEFEAKIKSVSEEEKLSMILKMLEKEEAKNTKTKK